MNRLIMTALAMGLFASSLEKGALADSKAEPTVDKAAIRDALIKQRKAHLARFHKYRLARVYPHNTYDTGIKNVWSDAEDHLCAVATMMKSDGLDAIVEATGKNDNFVRVAEVTTGPLADWVLTSGFTQEEVVMIQQPSAADIEQMDREYRAEQRRKARARAREDNRLATNYRATEKVLAESTMSTAGLDLAVERLAKRPDLAMVLLAKK